MVVRKETQVERVIALVFKGIGAILVTLGGYYVKESAATTSQFQQAVSELRIIVAELKTGQLAEHDRMASLERRLENLEKRRRCHEHPRI